MAARVALLASLVLATATAHADDTVAPPSAAAAPPTAPPVASPAPAPPALAPAAAITPPSATPAASIVAAPVFATPVVAAPVTSGSRKSPATAVALSLGVTLGSVALLAIAPSGDDGPSPIALPAAIGVLVGPSVGHWYAGRAVNPGMIGRGIGATVALTSSVILIGCIFGGDDDYDEEPYHDDDDDGSCALAGAGMVGGAVVYTVSGVYEIFSAASSARDYNRRHGFDLQVTPTAMRAADGSAPGLALSGRF